MVTTVAVTKAIATLRDAHQTFNLRPATETDFFSEWQDQLPSLSTAEMAELDKLKKRYLYYMQDGEISEGTVNVILLSPLLNILGLCDPPYRIQGEKWVRLQLETDTEDGPITLDGRIDTLVLQQRIWVVVLEGKRGGFSVLQAIPQALAYMMAKPTPNQPTFGLVSNGYDYLFLKVVPQVGTETTSSLYALSHNFTLLSDEQNNLIRVGKSLKYLCDFNLKPG